MPIPNVPPLPRPRRSPERAPAELAPRLPLPIPAPIRAGAPGEGYPWQWSIVPYLPGEPATNDPSADLLAAAEVLAGFLAALHRPTPPDAPANPVRGIPLARRAGSLAANLAAVGPIPDHAVVLRVRADELHAPVFGQPPVWLHAYMHPANILVPPEVRPACWDQYRSDGRVVLSAGLWTRARGWALALGLVFLAHSVAQPGAAEPAAGWTEVTVMRVSVPSVRMT
jgi:hypothetical protein